MVWYKDWIDTYLKPKSKINPDLDAAIIKLIAVAKENGLSVKVISDYRS